MIPLYNETDFLIAKSKDLLELECVTCKKSFKRLKKDIKRALLGTRSKINFCSHTCKALSQTKKQNVVCCNCNTTFQKKIDQIKKSPNNFCSSSCSATYNNKHKKHGTRRSKLEVYLEEQLTLLYPNLQIDYNQKTAIGSELDIHIPSLKLAFELNGIFHYEPIFGDKKFNQIQKNDISKSKACYDHQIDLCVIDTSTLKYFKPVGAQKYLNIINNIIKERISLIF